MAYTTINKSTDYFNTKLYTGNGSTNAITGVGFQPDFLWIKSRSDTKNHNLWDAVRGNTKRLISNSTGAESTETSITSFDSDGFTLDSGTTSNGNSLNFASWNWKAGTSFTNDASATGIGTIDSTGSVNDTAGFSIVSYTGTGSAGTIKHGLSSVPYMMIIKKRNSATGSNWMVYHKSISGTGDGHIWLDLTNAASTDTNSWNNTAPTSSVFSIGTRTENNGSGDTFIAYCFAEKQGFSKFGSYVGNGSTDGTFVYTGFKPAFVIIKRTDASSVRDWFILDNKRDTENPVTQNLETNNSDAEVASERCDFLSNGFKLTTNSGGTNVSNGTFIYMAFGQSLVGSNNVPCTAR